MNGIDISQWQGDMDLTPYKDGFVIIRGGFWTSADPWAERNIAKCEKLANDIPYTKFGLAADQVRHVYAGTTEPGAELGSDGDIYLMYSE